MKSSYTKERILYAIDNVMARGSFSIIIALSFAVILLILVLSTFIWSIGSNPSLGFMDQFWVYFNTGFGRSAATGNWTYRLTTFLLVIISILFSSIIIGAIANSIRSKISELQEGTSKVIESNHTVILGWSESIYIVINEIIEANKSQPSGCIVVLGHKSGLEMQEAIHHKINFDKSTRVIFRKGSTTSPEDIKKLSISEAKSIIIDIDDDIDVVKTILALFKNKEVKENKVPITCKISHSKNMPVAEIAGEGLIKFIPVFNFIGRINAQACLHPGVADVLLDLLDFSGSEVYFHHEESLVGKTYKEALVSYNSSSVVGIANDSLILINPDAKTYIGKNDQLIIISLDDNLIKINNVSEDGQSQDKKIIKKYKTIIEKPKILFILGWNNAAPIIIDDLIGYLPEGSQIDVINKSEKAEKHIANLKYKKNIIIQYKKGDIRERTFLESTNILTASNVLLLRSSVYEDSEMADAATLFTLITLREIRKQNNADFTILSEVLNPANADLVPVVKSDDFVMSEKIIHLMMAQLSENPSLNEFFNELMQPEGSEIYFRKISDYIDINQEVKFTTLIEAALMRSETAFGFRLNKESKDKSRNYGIYINPDKSIKRKLENKDELIVFAEE